MPFLFVFYTAAYPLYPYKCFSLSVPLALQIVEVLNEIQVGAAHQAAADHAVQQLAELLLQLPALQVCDTYRCTLSCDRQCD